MDYQHRSGLRHRLDDQHSRHDRPRREMALKKTFVDRHALDAGRPRVRHHVDNLVDHQKWMAMRDHFHDPLNIDLRDLLLGASRIDHHLSFFRARRCNAAVCLMNSVSGTAGVPHTVAPAGMSRMIPLFAAIRTPRPICKWPASPPCPPTMTKSSSLVLPEIPT